MAFWRRVLSLGWYGVAWMLTWRRVLDLCWLGLRDYAFRWVDLEEISMVRFSTVRRQGVRVS